MRKIFARCLALTLITVMLLSCFAGCDSGKKPSRPNGPVTLDIVVNRHPEALTSADEIWYFKYMEYWFEQQGYDVTINVQDSNSKSQVNLMLDSNSMPDIVWGHSMSNAEVVRYGVEEGMLLDWTPYLTKELMPNLLAQYEKNPSMRAAETAPDGGIYGLPYITPYPYSTIPGMVNRMFVRQSWLQEVDLDMPTTESRNFWICSGPSRAFNAPASGLIPSSAMMVSWRNICGPAWAIMVLTALASVRNL